MGSNYIINYQKILGMFAKLAAFNIFTNEKVAKKLAKLVDQEVDIFICDFLEAFLEKNFEYNRFEILFLTSKQKKLLDGNILMRYEYRYRKNLRTIFALENNKDKTIYILDVFTENGGKTKGKDSYDKAIDNAIKNYIEIKEVFDEN